MSEKVKLVVRRMTVTTVANGLYVTIGDECAQHRGSGAEQVYVFKTSVEFAAWCLEQEFSLNDPKVTT